MNARPSPQPWILATSFGLSLGLALACSNQSTDEGGSTQGEDTGDEGSCQPGTEFCECLGGSVCEGDLVCVEGYCVEPGSEGSGDGDGDTSGDGDGDTSGDGDGDTSGDGDGDTSGDGDGDTSGDGDGDTSGDGDGDTTGDGDGDGDTGGDPFDCENRQYPVNVLDGGGYDTVAAALAAAPPGATVEVCPGVYAENLTVERDLTLLGSGVGVTILDGSNNGSVIFVDGVNLTMSGFTVQNGSATTNVLGGGGTCGGGMAIEYSNGQQVEISDCEFTQNEAGHGAAICSDGTTNASDADMSLTNLFIHDNHASIDGGGVFTYSDLVMTDCEVVQNDATYHGGGLYISYNTVTVTGGQVRENQAEEGGGAYIQSPATLDVVNSDWGEGQLLENLPDDVGCYVDSFGWFGDNVSFSCSVPDYDMCSCG